jgi:nitrite reductase (NADH) small subunit
MRYRLFPAAELERGVVRSTDVAGVPIVVVHSKDGNFYALRDRCSHQGAPLSGGRVEALMTSGDDMAYRLDNECEVIRCPWHWYEFDVRTGRSVADPQKHRVRAYPVTVVDGFVTIER